MTTDADNNDPRVSDAYREMAHEETPAELDRKVLAMAAAGARTPRGLPRTWFRPLAWAATIALSFALVLEITQVEDVQLDQAASPRADADLEEIIVESPLPADAVGKQEDEASLQQRLNKRSSDAPAPESASVEMNFAPAEPSLLREAEEQARMRSEAGRAVDSYVETKEQSEGCGKDASASAQTWYECVRALRDSGQTDLAQRELEALLAEFPDFREPPGDQ